MCTPGEERLYQITQADDHHDGREDLFPACHTIIPRRVWASHDFTYIGLKIYLRKAGEGILADCRYAAQLIRLLSL